MQVKIIICNQIKREMARFYTDRERAFIVEKYHETKNCTQVKTFEQEFPGRRVPHRQTILYNVRKYREHRSSQNRNEHNPGRRRAIRIAENVAVVREILHNNPNVSCRRNGSGLSSASFNRIVRLDLNFHPYQMIERHELLADDYDRRMAYCRWFVVEQCQDPEFLPNIIIGDEATFAMNGSVNTRNTRAYAPKGQPPPDFVYEKPNSREKSMSGLL